MKKILCPLDFTEASMNGLAFAFETARKFGSELLLFHSVHPSAPRLAESNYKQKDLSEIEEEAKEKLESICEKMGGQNHYAGINYMFYVKAGLAEDAILNIITDRQIDMVIMGSKGAQGIETLFGSLSAEILSKASCPVIVIPQHFKYRDIKNITYATDLKWKETEGIKYITRFAQAYNAHISFLNIQKKDHEDIKDIIGHGENMLNEVEYKNMSFHVIEKEDVIKAISEFAQSSNADLIVMSTRERNIIEKVFSQSHTKEIAYHTEIPLLAMHKEKTHAPA